MDLPHPPGLPPPRPLLEKFCFSLKCILKISFFSVWFSLSFFFFFLSLYFWRAGVRENNKINLELESFNFGRWASILSSFLASQQIQTSAVTLTTGEHNIATNLLEENKSACSLSNKIRQGYIWWCSGVYVLLSMCYLDIWCILFIRVWKIYILYTPDNAFIYQINVSDTFRHIFQTMERLQLLIYIFYLW